MRGGVELGLAPLRVARPTGDLEAAARFYHDGLGLDVPYELEGHEGFDGVMLGREGAGYHLEFTRQAGHRVGNRNVRSAALGFSASVVYPPRPLRPVYPELW
jgi:hypothetical protein